MKISAIIEVLKNIEEIFGDIEVTLRSDPKGADTKIGGLHVLKDDNGELKCFLAMDKHQ